MSHLVSIIITAYNRIDYTIEALESVLRQSYPNIEIIIVDNGSTDATKERLQKYGDKIKYVYKENKGVCPARNLGIQLAKGEFIGILDNDDLYLPNKIEENVKFLTANLDYGLVHSDVVLIDENGREIKVDHHAWRNHQGFIKDRLIIRNFINNVSPLWRKECFNTVGGYNEKYFPPADWDMWLRISEKFKIGYIAQPLAKYRVSSAGCFRQVEDMETECLDVIERFFKRNTDLGQSLKNQALASYHRTIMLLYFLKGEMGKFNEHLRKSIARNPFDFKVCGFWVFYHVWPGKLKSLVQKAVLHS